jgi:hypothetical protein
MAAFAVINHPVQGLDFIALDGLFIPLPGAQAAEREREDDEQVHLEVFHGLVGRGRL